MKFIILCIGFFTLVGCTMKREDVAKAESRCKELGGNVRYVKMTGFQSKYKVFNVISTEISLASVTTKMYNKEKALQILEQMLEDEKNPNVVCGLQDIQYALSLGLICYSEHLSHWSDIPEHSNQDTKEYFAALHNIHKTLVEAGIFDDVE